MAFKMTGWGGYQNSPLKQESPITDEMMAARRKKAPHRWGSSAKRGVSDERMRVIMENELKRKTKKAARKQARLKEEDRQDIVWNPSTESYFVREPEEIDEKEKKKNKKKKKNNKSWQKGMKASNNQLNEWVKLRNSYVKGTPEYNVIQNKINEALGNKKRH